MKIQKLTGIHPALITAFDENGVNLKVTATLVDKLLCAGVDGMYIGGSSGEMVLQSVSERKALLECVIEAAAGRGAMIAHIGAMSTADSTELAKHAKKAGADAVSSVTPLYYKYSFREVKNYYARIAEAAELPVIIYNIPALTGMVLNADQLGELLSIPGVGGMKFTSSDFYQLERLRSRFPDHVFYNGSDEMLLSGLAAGADGGIGTTYNFQPEKIVNIRKAYLANDMQSALKLQSEANAAIEVILRNGVLPSTKKLLELMGLNVGLCREPFMPLTDEMIADLRDNALPMLDTAWLQ
ncbi:MAG: N-acetylneuraminate lyase [Ruminococcaceae bacterium]|nr:N-acetylneuraminate lyase [Oscillospiraceae bacterium]